MRVAVFFIISVVISACAGPPGAAGANGRNGNDGVNGVDGSNGVSAALVLTEEPVGANCEFGGTRIETGLDENANATLDAEEVSAVAFVCNAPPPLASIVDVVQEPPGANCGEGGTAIRQGLDSDRDAVLDAEEVLQTSYVCEHNVPSREVVLFQENMEAGLTVEWTQEFNATTTFAASPSSDFPSSYPSEGTAALVFDEVERYRHSLDDATPGRFSLYFYDDASDTDAIAWVGAIAPAGQDRIGVFTDTCGDRYYYSTAAGLHTSCTSIQRRTGWHRIEFVRDGASSRGFIDNELVFETNVPGRGVFELLSLEQEFPGQLLSGLMIDDITFVKFE